MTSCTVRLWPDPVLSAKASAVGPITPEIAALVADLFDTMYAAPGRGLAAPQVGVLRRLFVMDAGWKEGTPTPLAFVDPAILAVSGETVTGPEGCLSIPGVTAEVSRAARVRVAWTDATGIAHDRWFGGFEAICIQHENDHLDGILTFDRIAPDEAARLKRESAA